MKRSELDLSDVYARYAGELDAFRVATRVVVREIFRDHLAARLESGTLSVVRESLPLFGKRLLDHLLDTGDAVADVDGHVRLVASPVDGTHSTDVIAAYAAGNPARSSVAYFLAACRDIAGGVLAGEDGFRLIRQRDPRGVMKQWETVMLDAPILEPCRVFAARALVSRLGESAVVLEGGAGVGVVLRTLLKDTRLAAQTDRIAAYHFTDLDPALVAVGRVGISRVASPSLQKAMVYRRLDLDAFGRDATSSGLTPGSVDCVVLEHVLYDVADLHGTLMSIRKVLKPDGALVFTGAFRVRPSAFFPCEMLQLTLASYQRAQLDPPYRSHVGYLTLDEWTRSLARAGFEAAVYPPASEHERTPHGGIIAYPA